MGSPPAKDLESDNERDEGGAIASLTAPFGPNTTSDCARDEPDQGELGHFFHREVDVRLVVSRLAHPAAGEGQTSDDADREASSGSFFYLMVRLGLPAQEKQLFFFCCAKRRLKSLIRAEILQNRLKMEELQKKEADLLVLGILESSKHTSDHIT